MWVSHSTQLVTLNCVKNLDSIEEDEEFEKYKISKDDRLIIASLKLPVEVYRDKDSKWKARDAPVSVIQKTLSILIPF